MGAIKASNKVRSYKGSVEVSAGSVRNPISNPTIKQSNNQTIKQVMRSARLGLSLSMLASMASSNEASILRSTSMARAKASKETTSIAPKKTVPKATPFINCCDTGFGSIPVTSFNKI